MTIERLIALDIDEALCPWAASVQDIVQARADRRITDDETIRLMLGVFGGAVVDFEQRLNRLEGKPEGIGQG